MTTSYTGTVIIIADGGCSGNGSPDATAYGSFVALAFRGDDMLKRYESGRLDYPQHHTNNAAEIQIAIDAMRFLLGDNERVSYPVRYQTDSRVAIGWLTRGWKVKAAHLVPLVTEARQLTRRFANLSVEWVPRESIVTVLGH